MRIRDIIRESPIEISHAGDFQHDNPDGYSGTDRRWATSSKALSKAVRVFERCPYKIKLILLNRYIPTGVRDDLRELQREIPGLTSTPGWITLVMIGDRFNEHPMSPWMIAHRLSHGMESFDNSMSDDFHDPQWVRSMITKLSTAFINIAKRPIIDATLDINSYYQWLGTMRSARANSVNNTDEFAHELFAQYLLNGKVVFRKIPEIQPMVDKYQQYIDAMFKKDLADILGKVVVI